MNEDQPYLLYTPNVQQGHVNDLLKSGMTRAPFREVISLGGWRKEKKNTDKWFDNFLIIILSVEETNNMICDLEKKHLTCTIKNNKMLRVIQACLVLSMYFKVPW